MDDDSDFDGLLESDDTSAAPMVSPYPDAAGVTGGTPVGMVNPYPSNYGGGAPAVGIDPATFAYMNMVGLGQYFSPTGGAPQPASQFGPGNVGVIPQPSGAGLKQPQLMPTANLAQPANYPGQPPPSTTIGKAGAPITGMLGGLL
jgi:hypothetical protein